MGGIEAGIRVHVELGIAAGKLAGIAAGIAGGIHAWYMQLSTLRAYVKLQYMGYSISICLLYLSLPNSLQLTSPNFVTTHLVPLGGSPAKNKASYQQPAQSAQVLYNVHGCNS